MVISTAGSGRMVRETVKGPINISTVTPMTESFKMTRSMVTEF